MSGVDPPLVSRAESEERRPSTSKSQPSGRRSAPSGAQYFDLSSPTSAKNADRKLASRSADKVHPRLQQSPMLSSTANSAPGPRPGGPQMNPWSVTEVPEEEDTNEAHVATHDESLDAGEESSASSSEDEPEPEVTERFRHRRLANRRPTVHEWSEGPAVASDEYDTDLEEDFPPESLVDATGGLFYEEKCQKKGIVPVTYLLRNMGEGNLRMRHHYLGGDGTRPLAQALKKNTVCEEIDLSDNYIEGSGAAALADTLKENMFIVNLNVSNNFIRSEGAEKMAEMLESNTTLKTLSLQGNQLSDEDAKRIAESLKNNMSLSCLDLSHNKFGEIGGIYLAQGIALNIGLADLDLSWNCIREKGGVAIAKAVAKNTALEILDLSWNGLSYTGTVALANALKTNKALKVLDLSNNRVNPEGAKVLGKALAKNIGLETLLLGLNPMGADGVEAILRGAAAHPRLKLLGIENTMDLTMVPHLLTFVKELQESRDIMIMATTGPPQQSRINTTVLAVFDRFLTENADRMEDLFNQMDKDGSGDVTLEELKYGLKDFGLRLTSKQLDTLLDELDADKSGTIEYSELMQGTALIKREKQKMDRAAQELMRYKDNPPAGPANGGKSKAEVAVK